MQNVCRLGLTVREPSVVLLAIAEADVVEKDVGDAVSGAGDGDYARRFSSEKLGLDGFDEGEVAEVAGFCA